MLHSSAAINGTIMTQEKEAVKAQIALLKQKEQQIFKTLHVSDLKGLNERMKDYREAVINFSGLNLQDEFIGILEAENAEEYYAFEEAIKEILNQEYIDEKGEVIIAETMGQKALEILNSELSKKLGRSSQRFTSLRGLEGKISPGRFTKYQKNRWKELFKTEHFNKYPKAKQYVKKYLQELSSANVDSSVSDNRDSISTTTIFTWKTGTRGLKYTEAKELYPKDSEELNEINIKMTNFIVSKVPQDQQLIREIINHVLQEDPHVFFVGGNIKDITGLLGEIAGLYYLSKLLGGFSRSVLQWRGGTHTGFGGTKPHQDIILEGLGIQVKNTIKEDLEIVSFANAGIETMLDKAWLPQDVKNLFLNFYGTTAFNVPYHKENDKYIQGAPSGPSLKFNEFEQWSKALGGVSQGIDRLLSLSAAFFLYMDVYEGATQMDANVLYLLGGTMFQTASNILDEILQNIEKEERNFNIRASYKSEGNRNIVSALNDNTRSEQYSKVVLNDIELKSSYNFKHLFSL